MGNQRIKLYQGSVGDCSYLAEREAINIYADPHHPQPRAVYDQLIRRGFRRSGEYVYRPGCTSCSACVPVRIACDAFAPRRTDRRNLAANGDLVVDYRPARYTDAYFRLYERYLAARHPDGGMDDPDPGDFERFLLNPWGETLFVEVRKRNRIIAVAVTDAISDALSAVYTFFDPDEAGRGLGRFCILQQIELCRSLSFPHLYLGYWVDGCRKMQYKTDFRPQQHFDGDGWSTVEPHDPLPDAGPRDGPAFRGAARPGSRVGVTEVAEVAGAPDAGRPARRRGLAVRDPSADTP